MHRITATLLIASTLGSTACLAPGSPGLASASSALTTPADSASASPASAVLAGLAASPTVGGRASEVAAIGDLPVDPRRVPPRPAVEHEEPDLVTSLVSGVLVVGFGVSYLWRRRKPDHGFRIDRSWGGSRRASVWAPGKDLSAHVAARMKRSLASARPTGSGLELSF